MEVNITNLKEKNRITIFCGDHNVNTSAIAIDLAMSIISGQTYWHGYKIRNRRKAVFFMDLLDCHASVNGWCASHKIEVPYDYTFIQDVDMNSKLSPEKQESYITSIKDEVPDVGLIIVDLGMFHGSKTEVMNFCNLLTTTFECNIICFDNIEASEIPTDCLTYSPLILSVTKDDKQIHNVSLYENGHSILKYKREVKILPFENNHTHIWCYNFIKAVKKEKT